MSVDENSDGIIDPRTFELLCPSRYISFTFPNPNANPKNANNPYSHHPLLRISVLDSPSSPNDDDNIVVAAMVVPIGREHDWIFSTFNGHLHLLLSSSSSSIPSPSRLILISLLLQSEPEPEPEPDPDPDPDPDPQLKPYARSAPDPDLIQRFQDDLLPLLLALSPRSSFRSGIPDIPFLSYHDDDLSSITPVDHLTGSVSGEMLVEDVEIDQKFRRRLRFKRTPNLVQSQVNLVGNGVEIGSLVQPYLGPMVAALSLLVVDFSEGPKTRVLCVGVGGGALLTCLRHKFGFRVVGIEADDVVVSVAKRHFGLVEDEFLKVIVGDGIELMESANLDANFDAIMVDLDSGDVLNGICAPPMEFVNRSVLLGARSVLGEKGIMVVNVIPDTKWSCYERMVDFLREVFAELYEIDVGNGENYVLIASVSSVRSVGSWNRGPLFERLGKVGVDRFVDCIKKI